MRIHKTYGVKAETKRLRFESLFHQNVRGVRFEVHEPLHPRNEQGSRIILTSIGWPGIMTSFVFKKRMGRMNFCSLFGYLVPNFDYSVLSRSTL